MTGRRALTIGRLPGLIPDMGGVVEPRNTKRTDTQRSGHLDRCRTCHLLICSWRLRVTDLHARQEDELGLVFRCVWRTAQVVPAWF